MSKNNLLNQLDIVISCYGEYVSYLTQAIESVPIQCRIIVTGDEDAVMIAQSISRAKLDVYSGPKNISMLRQLGLEKSRAKYICFLDCDDQLIPNNLEILLEAIDNDEKLIATTGNYQGTDTGHRWPPKTRARIACFKYGKQLLMYKNCFASVSACVIRRELIAGKIVFPDYARCADWHGSIVLSCLGKVKYFDIPTLRYRMHEGSLSRKPQASDELRLSTNNLITTAKEHAGSAKIWWQLAELPAKIYRSFTVFK